MLPYRAYVTDVGTNLTNVGDLTLSVGGVDICAILAGEGQTLSTFFAVEAGYTGYLYCVYGAPAKQSDVAVQFHIRTAEFGKAWRNRLNLNANSAGASADRLLPKCYACPEKTVMKVDAESLSATQSVVSADFAVVSIKNA